MSTITGSLFQRGKIRSSQRSLCCREENLQCSDGNMALFYESLSHTCICLHTTKTRIGFDPLSSCITDTFTSAYVGFYTQSIAFFKKMRFIHFPQFTFVCSETQAFPHQPGTLIAP